MPVFQETAHSSRALRVGRSRARPLPRLTPLPTVKNDGDENFEIVVIGVRVLFVSIIPTANADNEFQNLQSI